MISNGVTIDTLLRLFEDAAVHFMTWFQTDEARTSDSILSVGNRRISLALIRPVFSFTVSTMLTLLSFRTRSHSVRVVRWRRSSREYAGRKRWCVGFEVLVLKISIAVETASISLKVLIERLIGSSEGLVGCASHRFRLKCPQVLLKSLSEVFQRPTLIGPLKLEHSDRLLWQLRLEESDHKIILQSLTDSFQRTKV